MFQCWNRRNSSFRYLGDELEHKDGQIKINRQKYIDNISFILIIKARAPMKEALLNDAEKQTLRSMLRQKWVAKQSKPGVIFDACKLFSRVKRAKVEHLILPIKFLFVARYVNIK